MAQRHLMLPVLLTFIRTPEFILYVWLSRITEDARIRFTTQLRVEQEFALYIPNAFTPNKDGINESFIGQGIGFIDYDMWIIDRWGVKYFILTARINRGTEPIMATEIFVRMMYMNTSSMFMTIQVNCIALSAMWHWCANSIIHNHL